MRSETSLSAQNSSTDCRWSRMQEAQESDLELGRRVVPEQELLGNRLRVDDRHYNCSVNRSSNARNSNAPMMNAPNACAPAISHTVASGHSR